MQRIDVLLVSLGLASSRSHAQQMIEAGRVFSTLTEPPKCVDKASAKFDPATPFFIQPDEQDRYVSRGGLKLAGALQASQVNPKGATVLDVGMSTGGFTDCLLQADVARVVGVEVGHDQLAGELRDRPNVVCLEGINARNLTADHLGEHLPPDGFDGVVMDVSFISQTLILPRLVPLMKKNAWLLSLVKPQFEVGREGLGKGGIVRDTSLYQVVEEKIRQSATELGLTVVGWFDSPIEGGDGNREFFLYALKP